MQITYIISLSTLINLMTLFITFVTEKRFIIEKIVIPLAPTIVASLVGIAGVTKYYEAKNKEINEKILNEVYAPLYTYLVNQELFRKIYNNKIGGDYREVPIITSNEIPNNTKKLKTKDSSYNITIDSKDSKENPTSIIDNMTFNIKSNEVLEENGYKHKYGLSRNDFIKVKNSINIGLASQEMVTLLTMYELTVDIENEGFGIEDRFFEEGLEATMLKVDIETALRREIISGYKKYYKALGLKNVSKSNMWELTEDNINYTYEITEERKEKLRKDIKANPEKYTKI